MGLEVECNALAIFLAIQLFELKGFICPSDEKASLLTLKDCELCLPAFGIIESFGGDGRGDINNLSAVGGEDEFEIRDVEVLTAPLNPVDAGGVGRPASSNEQITGVCFYFNVESDFVSTLTEIGFQLGASSRCRFFEASC